MIVGLLTLAVVFLAAYFYGVRVGLRAGVAAGRRQADSEWAVMLENGMVGPGMAVTRPAGDVSTYVAPGGAV